MKFISLFAGIGGFDLGLKRAGMICDSMCEIDKNAQVILRHHFPDAKLFDDVKEIGIATHERKSIDLICGGFPCQDVSIAGKRQGLAGERSGLWFEFARIIDELEPQWVVIENVPGLLSSNKGKDFAIIIRWLAERGYGVAWRVLDAQYFGVPQRRRRVFIVGSFGDGRAAEVLFERESSSGDTPPSREKGQEVAYSLRANPSHSGDKGDGGINTTMISTGVAGTATESQAGAIAAEPGVHQQNYIAFSAGQSAGAYGIAADENVTPPIRAGESGTNRVPTIAWQNRQQSGEVRMQDDTMPTVSKQWGTGGNNVPFVGARRLTPTECERLQGFPDGWTDGQSDSTRYRQLGNAVAVPVIEWIGRRIMQNERI